MEFLKFSISDSASDMLLNINKTSTLFVLENLNDKKYYFKNN